MKKFLSLVLALIMVMSLVTVGAGAAFTDAEEITQTEAVELLTGLGVLSGYADGSFKPEGAISRGAAAKIITWLLVGTPKAQAMASYGVEEVPFPDVRKDSSTAVFVEYCKEQGIIGGYSDGTFRPYADLTGHAFLKMVLVALGVKDIDFTAKGWQVDAVAKAEEEKLLDGIDTAKVNLGVALSRENACQIAMNALTYTATGAVKYELYNAAGKYVTTYDNKDDANLILALRDGYTLKEVTDLTDSLGYKNWNLTPSTRTDANGLVYNTWTNGEATSSKKYVEYAAIAPELKLSYTKKVSADDIAKALGYEKEDYDDVKLNFTVNGIYDVDADVKVTGQGVETKVYETATEDTYTVIVVKKAVKTLESANIIKASEDGKTKAAVKIDGLTYETSDFKKGDTVLVTYGQKKGDTAIIAIEKADAITGKVTAAAADGSYIRIDGEKYPIAAINEDDTTTKYYKYGDTAYTYYLDTFGNIVKATDVKKDETTEDAKYIYVYDSAVSVKEGAEGDNLFETAKGTAAVQVKTIDLATGALSVKNLAVASKSGNWYLADKNGKATETKLTDKMELGLFGTYTFVEVDGKLVLTGKAATETVKLQKDKAVLATGKTATSTTTFTTVEVVYDVKDDTKVTGATVKTVTGIAKFPSTAKTIDAIVTAKDGIVSNILYITKAEAEAETVNYAIYKGAGEVGATASYDFYVGGEVVTYTLAKGADELTLKAGDVVALDLEDGKLVKAEKLTASKTGKVTLIDSTFVMVDDAVVYFAKTVETVDAGEKYAVAELAEKDTVSIYGEDGKAAFIVIAK